MTLKRAAAALAVAAVAATGSVCVGGAAQASDGAGAGDGAEGASRCAESFGAAVDAYVRTTDERDADGFAALLDRDVTALFADGETLYGRAATMDFIRSFFEVPGWTQTFDEKVRVVRGCKTGFVLWDSVYTPEGGEGVPLAIGVSFTHRKGEWRAIQNQDTTGPVH